METTTKVTGLWSTGRIMCAATLGAVVIAATVPSAGAYTAGSADYGQVLQQLTNLNAHYAQQTQSAIYLPQGGGGYYTEPKIVAESSAQLTASELGPWAPPFSPAGESTPSYLSIGDGRSAFTTTTEMVYPDGNTGPTSAFLWRTTNPYSPNGFALQGVFTDQLGNSVFESPNGNSYLDWLPYKVQNLALGTTAANWQQANADNNTYSIFKTNTGGSVFENDLGQSDLSATEFNTTGNAVRNSAFTTPSGDSVFMAQALALATGTGYGTHESGGTTPTASQSVFIAGTGAHSGLGTTGTGSVFVTDDTTNGNVGNSAFLDPYGNSYLDDITTDLGIMPANLFADSTSAPAGGAQITYNSQGQVVIKSPNMDTVYGSHQNLPITLTQLFAAANGITANFSPATGLTVTTPGYQAELLNTLAMSTNETIQQWYQSGGDNIDNQFAAALFNPPSSKATALVPYLSALGGWNNSTAFQNSLTTNETNLATAITHAEGNLDTQFNNVAPSTTPGTGTPAAALNGGWSNQWILPLNTLSTAVGTLTDADNATKGTNAGFAYDNNSHNVIGAIQDLIGRVQQLAGYNPPGNLLLYTKTTITGTYSGDGGDTANGTSTSYATLDAIDDGEFAFLAGAVGGMEWFRGAFGWLASFFGFWFLLFTIWKAWQLIYWGINGGTFPLLFNPHNRIPASNQAADRSQGEPAAERSDAS